MFFKKSMISTLSEKKNENCVLQTLIYPTKQWDIIFTIEATHDTL